MNNKQLVIGVIACFAISILFLLVIIWEIKKSIDHDAKIRFVTSKDPDALDILRHSAAHVMAQAILRLNKAAKLTIGPAVENQFYYDIDMDPVSEDDFPKIEAEMKKIIKEKLSIQRRVVSKAEALKFYKNEPYKLEMISDLEDETISFYEQGEFTDLCRQNPVQLFYRS